MTRNFFSALGRRSGAGAAQLEDIIYRGLAQWARWRGRTLGVLPLGGYGSVAGAAILPADTGGTSSVPAEKGNYAEQRRPVRDVSTDMARIMVRVLMVAPHTDRTEFLKGRRGYRQFLDVQMPSAPVTITLGNVTVQATTDRGGYVDTVVHGHGLPAGWHDAVVRTEDGPTTRVPIQIVGAHPQLGLVSDIDDTIMVTHLPRPLLALWNALVVKSDARKAVTGMPEFYTALSKRLDGPTVYLSTGAWNVIGTVRRFVKRNGYPRGTYLLTDWGPSNTGWFRSGSEHKRRELRRLAHDLPQVRWVLVGDDGQHDPQIYRDFAREYGPVVEHVVIRALSPGQHLLAHGTASPLDG